jgi:hypothetical protein
MEVAREFVVLKNYKISKKNWYKLKRKQKRTGIQFQLCLPAENDEYQLFMVLITSKSSRRSYSCYTEIFRDMKGKVGSP